jgi:ABC-2 type transport system permease protein
MSERSERTVRHSTTGFTGALRVLRFHLRRDRMMLFWWIAGNVLLYYSQAVSTDGLYKTQAELDKAAAGMADNAAFIAMAGPARALNTLGGQVAWQAAAFGAIVAALMSMFLVGRHTRAEEETGRDELVRASAVDREAPLVATTLLLVVIANVLLGALVAVSLISYGLPAAGSVALGLAAGLTGLVFGGVALVAAQLVESTRAAYGITGAVIGVAYALRAVGDVGNGALSWLSPIGWGQYLRPYAGEQWWPTLLSVVAIIVLGIASLMLFDRRDIGSGVWPARPGPALGSLGSASALAWRLQRGSVIGWTVGLLFGGVAYGSIGDDVADLIGDSEFSKDVFSSAGGSIVDSFYATAAVMLALIGAGFAIASVQRLRGEESAGFAESLLATALPRWRWAVAHLVVTVVGTLAVLLAAGLGMGLGFAMVTGDGSAVLRLTGATLPYAAPVLLLATLTWLAYGIHSRWAAVGWLGLGFCFVVMMFGALLQLPGWLMDVSPFRHPAQTPAEDFRIVPVVVLLAITAALGVVGMASLRRRDLVSN